MGDEFVIAVAGSRGYHDRQHVYRVLDSLSPRPTVLIHGACGLKYSRTGYIVGTMRGADGLAHDWARMRDVLTRFYPADWDRYGGPAGPRRNGMMLRLERPALLVAFPGGDGTQSAIDIAVQLDIPLMDERTKAAP